MQKKFIACALCIILCLSMLPTAAAAEPKAASFTDISGHWARETILTVWEKGLMNGVSDTKFDPNGPMTRGMFVTILGRLLHVDVSDWQNFPADEIFTDVLPNRYYTPYVSWAVHNGITNGLSETRFGPDTYVTRQQMARFIANVVTLTPNSLAPLSDNPFTGDFTDEAKISSWARDAVDMLQYAGILTGYAAQDGTYSFKPQQIATRAEGCVVLNSLSEALRPLDSQQWAEPEKVSIVDAPDQLAQGSSILLRAEISPIFASNPTLIWTSSNPAAISITRSGIARWQGAGSSLITVTTCNGLQSSVRITAAAPQNLAYQGESYYSKCQRIFGQYVDEPRDVYSTPAEAEAHMATVDVLVWDIGAGGQKVTRTYSLQVHQNIAATVRQIFAEIYALPSKPPIHSLGGYRWGHESEHTPGLAIDVNWEENYYCDPEGNALTGSFFDPARSEYSFPVGGEVEQIFAKYGFTRGIYWRSGYKDYMHFSFFGT